MPDISSKPDNNLPAELPSGQPSNSISVTLTVNPAEAHAGTQLDIRGTVSNLGDSVIDTRAWVSVLLVDGSPCQTWALAIANGLRDPRESALPPQQRVELRRVLPAATVLPPGRGTHVLILEVLGTRSPAVSVKQL